MIKLGDFIAREAGVSIDSVMLLRHSQRIVDRLSSRGVTIHDYTIVQPIGKPYDYRDPRKPRIDIVVVIVGNKVDTVYRVLGVEVENDTSYALNVSALTQHDKETGKPSRPARRFKMAPLQSAALSHAITGWERRQRTPVQRSSDAFFNEIEVDLANVLQSEGDVERELQKNVQRSLQDSPTARRKRLALAPKTPIQIEVRSTTFLRNSDVIAEVLTRAKGRCELCMEAAPFPRKSDGTPYLEVHHKVRLADGGEDTVENAHALCPNCHRREHFG
jgi:5-methylcytosine-specific restriction endonuclease McrA